MSLYRFFESYIEETPELLLMAHELPLNYSNLFGYMKKKQEGSHFRTYLDILLNDSVNKFSSNLQEYEILRLKSFKLGKEAQNNFNLTH